MDNCNEKMMMGCRNQSCYRVPPPGMTENNCSCPYQGIDRLPLSMSYVPWQRWQNLYDLDKAFRVGTIFAELDKPFEERSCCN